MTHTRRLGCMQAALSSSSYIANQQWSSLPYDSDREDGRFVTTMGFTNFLMRHGEGKLAYDPSAEESTRSAWRGQVRAKLQELMAFPHVGSARQQPAPVRLAMEARKGYRLERWQAFPEPGSVVPFLVLIPDAATASWLPRARGHVLPWLGIKQGVAGRRAGAAGRAATQRPPDWEPDGPAVRPSGFHRGRG